MSVGTSLALQKAPRRGFPRFPIKVPLDVIALRSGVPLTLPGRCADLSEGGVGAIVAGQLSAGQQVAVELRLPNVGLPVRAKAVVRYQGGMRCGFEFLALPIEQREMIRYWTRSFAAEPAKHGNIRKPAAKQSEATSATIQNAPVLRAGPRRWNLLLINIVALLILACAGWLHWQRLWGELETGTTAQVPMRVAPETMATRIVSKVEPIYPEDARRAGTQGLAVLDAVIAIDGTVKRLELVSGDDNLARAASEAVRQWKFEPYRSGLRPIEVETTIAVEFRLN